MAQDDMLTGGCNCRAVRYTLSAPPLAVVACHCTSCRRQSGAAYSVNLLVRAEAMTVEGTLTRWMDPDTESGLPLAREFCGVCGSPIRSLPATLRHFVVVKAGTLDQADQFAPEAHIWTCSKLSWVTLPVGIPTHATGAG
ncbi:MAG: GFA family protein [Candidatus Sphingomonas colombiensis]|nr:GFA family protein [Sphingomonas sp.]WEK43876.1 MAG: GFA family protein [Sphingomonas sp.]